MERQLHKKPLDIRMSVLICLGTMTFIHLGVQVHLETGGDATRVLGQVVTGIGFLGAGAIITRQGFVSGLTSAAVVWVLAAVGAAIGFGRYEEGVAISAATLVLLMLLQSLEDFMERLMRRRDPDLDPMIKAKNINKEI
jgi:putative Mg2+ transporter-C (MgtC) family protein